jgi:hypothetical protein
MLGGLQVIELAVMRGGRCQSTLASTRMDARRTLSDRAGGGKMREEPEQSCQLADEEY